MLLGIIFGRYKEGVALQPGIYFSGQFHRFKPRRPNVAKSVAECRLKRCGFGFI